MEVSALDTCRGARVHSDSWGTADATYDSLAADMDRFAWAYQDFLPVVAAGNFGYREQGSTLTSPAVAKNCVAVGEIFNTSSSLRTYHAA